MILVYFLSIMYGACGKNGFRNAMGTWDKRRHGTGRERHRKFCWRCEGPARELTILEENLEAVTRTFFWPMFSLNPSKYSRETKDSFQSIQKFREQNNSETVAMQRETVLYRFKGDIRGAAHEMC
jgi:hypothetical protein